MVIQNYHISPQADLAVVDLRPDGRFTPRCHRCKGLAPRVRARQVRAVRDLDLTSARLMLRLSYRKVYCPACQKVLVEDLEPVEPCQRITLRLAFYAHQLCRWMSLQAVAGHLGLDWKTVKEADLLFLQKRYGEPQRGDMRMLAVDEFSLQKGRRYATVVIDYQSGRILHVAEGNRCESLSSFFRSLSPQQRAGIEAIAMDMWDPYIKAVRQSVPHVEVVFDLFHAVKAFGRIIDQVRLAEYRRADSTGKEVIKGSKWLLLKNRRNLRQKEREHLEKLLELNRPLATVMILKEALKQLWRQSDRRAAAQAIDDWCALARSLPYGPLHRFARCLERYSYGIISHCDYPIHTGKLEGINNKIKVIKRRAYGYHDLRYFALKIRQAFDPDEDDDVLFRR